MTANDGFQEWRDKEAKELEQIVQKRIRLLQNPKNCSTAKILKCRIMDHYICGWGCQIHQVTECLIAAYGSGRTLIFDSSAFEYSSNGFKNIYKPLSKSCTEVERDELIENWRGNFTDARVIAFPDTVTIANRTIRPDFLPSNVPFDLLPRLEKLYEDPSIWWVGQIKKFATRYVPKITRIIQQNKSDLKFKNPIVGIHVRRTDKVTQGEADLVEIERFMEQVEEYFDRLEITEKIEKRRIFVATETPNIIQEIQEKYPKYEIIANYEAAKIAQDTTTRQSFNSLLGILTDVSLLVECDFVVVTLSSNVGRIVYELMQTERVNASDSLVSLDMAYRNYGDGGRLKIVTRAHQPKNSNEITADVGDILVVAPNDKTQDPLEWATNQRTRQHGLMPMFKCEMYFKRVDYFNFTGIE